MSNMGLTRKALKYNHSFWFGFPLLSSCSDRLGRLQKIVVIETFRQAGLRL